MIFYWLYGNELIDLEKIYRIGYYKVTKEHFSPEEINRYNLEPNHKYGKLIIYFDANSENAISRVFTNIGEGAKKFEEITNLLLRQNSRSTSSSSSSSNDDGDDEVVFR